MLTRDRRSYQRRAVPKSGHQGTWPPIRAPAQETVFLGAVVIIVGRSVCGLKLPPADVAATNSLTKLAVETRSKMYLWGRPVLKLRRVRRSGDQ